MPFAVKQQAETGSSVNLPLSRPVGQSAWPSHLYCKMSSDHNWPGMAATPHFTKNYSFMTFYEIVNNNELVGSHMRTDLRFLGL